MEKYFIARIRGNLHNKTVRDFFLSNFVSKQKMPLRHFLQCDIILSTGGGPRIKKGEIFEGKNGEEGPKSNSSKVRETVLY